MTEIETTPDETAVASAPDAAMACGQCAAPLRDDQDWCLSCGREVTRSSAGVPGLRSATAVLAVVLTLASGGVAAAYAALSADAGSAAADERAVALPPQAPPPGAAPAAVASTTTSTTATTAAADSSTPPAADAPASDDPGEDFASIPGADASVPPAASTPFPSTGGTTTDPATDDDDTVADGDTPDGDAGKDGDKAEADADADAGKDDEETATPRSTRPLRTVELRSDSARIYNPYGTDEARFGDPADAVDDDRATSFAFALEPGQKRTSVGVVLDLDVAYRLRAVSLRTPTPGMTVEIWATKERGTPVSIQDPAWERLATQLDVGRLQRIPLPETTDRYRKALVWITEPSASDAERVALSELELYE